MIGSDKVLGVIIARGGSVGLPGKNLADIGGRPMIAWSIEAARRSRYLDRTILSTDDRAIMKTARELGCDVPFARPAELADDRAKAENVVLHALDAVDEVFDIVVLLQATSPMRTAADIDAGLERCIAAGAPACISVQRARKSPYWMMTLDEAGRLKRLLQTDGPSHRRQDLPEVFEPNGAFYAARVPWFREHHTFVGEGTVAYDMPEERSIDIDTPLDLALARAVATDAHVQENR
jgi:CMP-N,N'-diacetyllegionaminic acid synthase